MHETAGERPKYVRAKFSSKAEEIANLDLPRDRARLVKEAGATARVAARDSVHYGSSTSLRRTGRIHADAYVAPRAS